MLFKDAARFDMRTRSIAALSVLALLGAGLFYARSGKWQSVPATPQHTASPDSGTPARMRPVNAAEQARVAKSFGNLPLSFEPNQGQTDAQVKFLSHNSHYNLFLTPSEAVFTLPVRSEPVSARGRRSKHSQMTSEAVLRMEMIGANPAAQVAGDTPVEGHTNYFIGRDASKWVHDVPQYARVNYRGVYPGVDLTFYGQQHQLEFDFVVKPGANADAIALGIEGAKKIATDKTGDLVLTSAAGDVRLHRPVAYQRLGDTRQPVDARFVVKGTEIALAIGAYDRSRELIIDPSVAYSTYLGAGNEDDGYAIAVDSAGEAFVTGQTASAGFPVKGALPTPNNALQGTNDAFVTKMKADGTNTVYSTFLGGTGTDSGNAIVIDGSGQAYVAGSTNSTDFPSAGANPFQVSEGGGLDAFAAVLNAAGNALVYTTYIGGSDDDSGEGIAVKGTVIYVAGSTASADFPATAPSGSTLLTTFQNGTGTSPTDGFATKIDLSNTANVASVYLGGSGNDVATGIAVDASGNAYVTGATFSTDFPVAGSAFQTHCGSDGNCNGGKEDSFVTEIKADFTQYVYSTYLGGSGADDASQIVVDGSGNAYVVGVTNSSDFPINGTNAAYKTTLTGTSGNAYVTVVKPGGSALLYSTYLGGSGLDTALGVALGTSSPPKVYITGQTSSSNFPTVSPTQTVNGGGNDAFVSELNPNVSGNASLIFSTYLGGTNDEDHFLAGIAVDSSGNMYVTGDTQSNKDFPVTPGTFKTTMANSGGSTCSGICRDAFVVKISPSGPAFTVAVAAISPAAISRGSSGTSTVTVTSTGASGTVNLGCIVTPAPASPPTCSLGSASGALASGGNLSTTLTIGTVKTGSNPITGSALWLPIPGLALLGAGFVRDKHGKRKLARMLLAGCALTGLLLMLGCGSGNGGGGGGGGGGTTTGSYTVTVTGSIVGAGSSTGTAAFTVQ
jgi:Beta-propeller repeat